MFVLQSGQHNTENSTDTPSTNFNFQPCPAPSIRRVSNPTATSALIQAPVQSQETSSSSAISSGVIKLTDHRQSVDLGVDSSRARSGHNRRGKQPLPPASKDRRRTTTSSSGVASPKKIADSCDWTAAARRHQQQKQQHKKKPETSPSVSFGGSSGIPMAFQAPYSAATTTAPGSAPIFTALPAASVILHGPLPVSARRCVPGAVLPPGRHQHVLVADQQSAPAPPRSRMYRAGPSTTRPGGNVAGWNYAAAAHQSAVCREYVLFGPSSVLLLR